MIIYPGSEVSRQMSKRGWDQATLAMILQWSPSRVSALVCGKKRFTADVIILLASVFETDWAHWVDIIVKYDLATHSFSEEKAEAIRQRAKAMTEGARLKSHRCHACGQMVKDLQ